MTCTVVERNSQATSSKSSENAAAEFPREGPSALRVMIVGDSISHGNEGDWTWRYRIWEWFRREGVDIHFVGPWKGTVPPSVPKPPQPPPLVGETPPTPPIREDGGYAKGMSPEFHHDANHLARSGWQVMQVKQVIQEQVAKHQPDLILVELGFNDIGWFVSGPDGTLDSMRTLVDQARAAKSDVKFAIANVPMRTPMEGRGDLPVNTKIYNTLLETAIPHWSTSRSKIELVRFCENYSPSSATHDGLHPNALGEYQIAQAFSRTLIHGFGLGSNELAIPSLIPTRPTPTPSNFRAMTSASGITVKWDAVYGAFGYELRARSISSTNWNFNSLGANRFDTIHCRDGDEWEYQVRTNGGDAVKSPWSEVVRAVAHPRTAPGPKNIVTKPIPGGFVVSWDPPDGDYAINRYGVITFDGDIPGAFPSEVGVRLTTVAFGDLPIGHRFSVAVETWTDAGGGIPSLGPEAVVG